MLNTVIGCVSIAFGAIVAYIVYEVASFFLEVFHDRLHKPAAADEGDGSVCPVVQHDYRTSLPKSE